MPAPTTLNPEAQQHQGKQNASDHCGDQWVIRVHKHLPWARHWSRHTGLNQASKHCWRPLTAKPVYSVLCHIPYSRALWEWPRRPCSFSFLTKYIGDSSECALPRACTGRGIIPRRARESMLTCISRVTKSRASQTLFCQTQGGCCVGETPQTLHLGPIRLPYPKGLALRKSLYLSNKSIPQCSFGWETPTPPGSVLIISHGYHLVTMGYIKIHRESCTIPCQPFQPTSGDPGKTPGPPFGPVLGATHCKVVMPKASE